MNDAWVLPDEVQRCPAGRLPRQCTASTHAADLHATVQRLRSFNRSVSHDLRGPLGAMGGAARLAIDAISRSDTPRALRLLTATARQADMLAGLVNDLLAMAEAEETSEEDVPLDLAAHAALAQLASALPVGFAPVSCVRISAMPTALATPGLIRQVFVNLIGNALKFSGRSADPCIEVDATAGYDGIHVVVKDNGVGFDAPAAATLFQPFSRLHGNDFPGSGVGLSLVKRIVERHGGRIWAHSLPGQGASFHFTVRAARQSPGGDNE
jgi:signal transduction histidine kinase